MKWFYDLKIAIKLPAIFCLLAAISGAIGWIALSKVGQMKANSASLYRERTVGMCLHEGVGQGRTGQGVREPRRAG